ncbi:MAG: phenylalanine--tRNA ligase subunit beta [Lentimicrobium sp.]|jgi:phenylalanyl-tRNA synthetase beta chain|nr:phenylalanine--tRNA ligase subunit beta [Lentimicrobium sp.]
MKISLNWLRDYLETELSVDELSHLLTDIGLEVEAVEEFESIKGGLKGVVTGQVIECERHPNADKLSLTKVDVGSGILLNIVCGAPNVEAGQKVMVATIGTTLYMGEEVLEIRRSKIRGEASEGMICAEDELGIGHDHQGIVVLPTDTKVGLPASTWLGLETDVVFEIGLTPNRADATSHIGVARDLAAALAIRFPERKEAKVKLPDVSSFKVDNNNLPVTVEVRDAAACPRYSGITLQGITVGPSPSWLANRLKAIGVRPINNVVDATNYVLFEYGQPLHAFDAKAIVGNRVIVNTVPDETRFVTLDGVERKLSSQDLMICNASAPMCIAGVFGGQSSGVTMETTGIFLESACFNAVSVRKTSNLHGLKTDASFRFERGTDPEITVTALKRAALLIRELAGGSISSEIQDVYPNPVKPVEIEIAFDYINHFVGQVIPANEVVNIIRQLGITVLNQDNARLKVAVPAFKVDVTGKSDLIEEVLRIYGYNKINSETTHWSGNPAQHPPLSELLQHKISDYLVSRGFNEIITNSLSSSEHYTGSKWFDENRLVKILNPLSKELDVMRQTLIFSGLESLAFNINRKHSNLNFFEFGRTYALKDNPVKGEVASSYDETRMLALYQTGDKSPESWHNAAGKTDFYRLHSVIQGIMTKTGAAGLLKPNNAIPPFFEYGMVFKNNDNPVYCIGQLNKKVCTSFDVSQSVFYAGIHWDNLLELIKNQKVTYVPVSRFPEVRRDLALVIDKTLNYAQLEEIAFRYGKKMLKQVNLFDVYEGESIGNGKKSYALSFILQDENKTLTDKEIDKFMARLIETYEKEAGAIIRK